jgi:hypothetical protein
MSNFGWANCASCHPKGLSDGVTWMFPDGPRQTIPLNGTFDRFLSAGTTPTLDHIRVLNWSAVRDEVQDFELNTRGVSGGEGLITDGQPVINLINADGSGLASSGRSQDLDAMAFYQANGIRTPTAPPISDPDFFTGLGLFTQAGCAKCHAGRQWSNAIRNFTPPPKVDRNGVQVVITDGQLAGFLRDVGTFDGTKFNEVRVTPLNDVPTARGVLGMSPPSLLGLAASAPYLHSGQAQTLEEVLANTAHRRAGQAAGQADPLDDPAKLDLMVRFLRSIDETKDFPLPR